MNVAKLTMKQLFVKNLGTITLTPPAPRYDSVSFLMPKEKILAGENKNNKRAIPKKILIGLKMPNKAT